ncbi:MAG: hypothetical protein SFY92_00235 [Verrucomicrobiae bacterium]|nr:hypothetical protein [Verrucomicrobiae bacterium]
MRTVGTQIFWAAITAWVLGTCGMDALRAETPDRSLEKSGKVADSAGGGREAAANSQGEQLLKLRRQLAQQEEAIDELVKSLGVAQAESEMFQKQLQEMKLKAEITGSNQATAALEEKVIEAVKNLYASERDRRKVLNRLKELDEKTRTLLKSAEFSDFKARAELEVELRITRALLEELTRSGDSPTEGVTLQSASVMNVNPSLALVILNVGRAHGAKENMPFVILRNDRVVGNVRIIDVREKYSGAVIERFRKDNMIAVGDRAKIATEK